MLRAVRIFALLLAVAPTIASQSIPAELLSTPSRLVLDKPTTEVRAGTTLAYTVTLKNAKEQPVAASNNLQLTIETPTGLQSVVLPAGQSSATFTWQAANSGVMHMTVRSGKLLPASGLVLVTPSNTQRLHPTSRQTSPATTPTIPSVGPGAGTPGGGVPEPTPMPLAASILALPPSFGQARKIRLYVEPLPVYGNPVDHVWKANVSVAALGGAQDSLTPVSTDVNVHFQANLGQLSQQDIVLSSGQFGNFNNPVLLTSKRSGKDNVGAISSLGPAEPVPVEYLQPPAANLRLSVSDAVLTGSGSSSANVQVCLLDESESITSADQDVHVTLTATGRLASPALTIPQESSCSTMIVWTSGAGPGTIRAESAGLKPDSKSIAFPSFPWYFVWLAAAGGLLGALISQRGNLFSARWWSHTWRGLVLGAVLGSVFYLFARFGAITLPKDSPINIQNIPVVSGVGSLLLGFLGGLYGRKLWKTN